jgi:hypothetical protein
MSSQNELFRDIYALNRIVQLCGEINHTRRLIYRILPVSQSFLPRRAEHDAIKGITYAGTSG